MIILSGALKWNVDFTPNFHAVLLRLWFEARIPVQFPVSLTANFFRGALGLTLPRSLFAPQTKDGPSGLHDPPRPFLLRARHLNGIAFPSGSRIPLDLHLFSPIGPLIVSAFRKSEPRYGSLVLIGASPQEALTFPLSPLPAEPGEATVHFLTPTELKIESGLAPIPEFPVLFARAAARLRTLANLYSTPLPLDFAHLTQISQTVRLTGHALTHEFAQRYSTRTGQTHPLGGFTGNARYEGPLRELLPILNAACFTGVGRQTVWGKGEIMLKR